MSKISTSNESDLTCGSLDKEVALETPEIPEISELTETPENPESSIYKNVESKLEDRKYCDDMETSSEKEDAIITKKKGKKNLVHHCLKCLLVLKMI